MLLLAVMGTRLAQFICAMILMGSPLFLVYGAPASPAPLDLPRFRPLILTAAAFLLVGAALSLMAQTAVMTDSVADAFKADSVRSVLIDTQFGKAIAWRLGFASAALLAILGIRPSRPLWALVAALGAGVVATFAWTGHGASDDGTAGLVHLVGDIIHLLAAAVWLGALAALALLLSRPDGADADLASLHTALDRFSGVGATVVALLLATGLINTWFLIGPSHLGRALAGAYGLLLIFKVVLFVGMLGLAALNRFRLTPRLGASLGTASPAAEAVAALRRSIVLESLLALLVLTIVSLLGVLAPPASS